MGDERESGRTGWHRWRVRLLLIPLAAVLLLLLLSVAALLLIETDLVGERLKEAVLPQLSAQLGRQVSIGELEVSVLPRPSVRVGELRIAGVGGGPALLEAEEAVFSLGLWPLLRSFGRELQVSSVVVRGPRLNLVRGADGVWNFAGLAPGGGEREVGVAQLRIEDGVLRVIDRAGKGEPAAVALTRIAGTASGLKSGEPFAASLRAAFASGRENLALTLARRGQGALTGTLEASGVSVDATRSLFPAGLGAAVRGGELWLRSELSAEPSGAMAAKGTLRLDGLSLRGSPARAGLAFQASAGRGAAGWTMEVEQLEVEGPGVSLRGGGRVQTEPLRGRVDLKGTKLALDVLLALQPASEQGGGPLPKSMLRRLERAELEATVAIDRVSSGALVVTGLQGAASLRSGVLEISRASAGFYGGTVALEDAVVRLARAVPDWKLQARLEGVDLGRALREVAGASPLIGTLGGRVALRGAGNDWRRLARTMRGEGRLSLRDGEWSTLDLPEAITTALTQVLSRAGIGGGGFESKQGTALPAVELSFALDEGWMRLVEPLGFGDGWGRARLSGAIGLDQRVDLVGELFVAPEFLARWSGGMLRSREPLELPVTLLGTLADPQVRVSPPPLAPSLLDRLPGRRD